ncbi:alpha/beta hydrolase [Roseomonas populi]|uniref:Alpha/beta hydrolase n=1 Tax=Roseomonas populi TaxID=3121582 RepID=A0ABT1X595_9PROT|nr:alpha/beta hydrolase [Roseomonas pecuniae]MCR0983280.1 alpha/beta hydrolase [Roseomonas pecuniae]
MPADHRAAIDNLPELATWLEGQYDLRGRHPEREPLYAEYAARSARFRDSSSWSCLRYAAPERCTIDWFPPPGGSGAVPLLVFLHGGFWRAGDKRVFSFLAEPFVAEGVAVALIGYELAPAVSVTRIAEQVAEAVAWLVKEAGRLGFDPSRITLSGHSAGGHLSALLSAAPPAGFGVPRFHGVMPISGIFRLAPMLLTSINHAARITPEEAVALSPALKAEFHGRRYHVLAGAGETEEFVSQTREFGAMMEVACPGSTTALVPGRHHFDIFQDLADPASPVFREALSLVSQAA